jgi:hypothetical protein
MTEDNYSYLKKIYQKLYDTLEKNNKKITKKSLILTFFNIKSNDRNQLLREGAIQGFKIPATVMSYLEKNNLIRQTDEAMFYSITAKGIYEVECKKEVINNDIFLNFFDKKFFNPFKLSEKSLSEKQKIIIFSMIAIRSFSEDSALDLKKSEKTLNAIQDVINSTYNKLKSLKLIPKLKFDNLYGKKGNEHPVSNLIRHTDELPKLTKNVYKALGNQKYYLDLFSNNSFLKNNLNLLFEKIFDDKKLQILEVEDLSSFCNKIDSEKKF